MKSKRGYMLVPRQDAGVEAGPPACEYTPYDDAYHQLRIASIFIILVTAFMGAVVPVFLASKVDIKRGANRWVFFVAKYFGTGVIVATAWMHLLAPAEEALGDPCLEDILPEYPWSLGIGLMTVMIMFFVELALARFELGLGSAAKGGAHSHEHTANGKHAADVTSGHNHADPEMGGKTSGELSNTEAPALAPARPHQNPRPSVSVPGGEHHLAHGREHKGPHNQLTAQMTAIFILEFGIIFHSIFIGLTLAVTDEFVVLFIVLIFHQTFEGLGLGSRLATAAWPRDKLWLPYVLGLLYAVSTPVAIAVGLGVRQSLNQSSATALIVNGVFDAISGGILMYTGLVELLGHEFMFNPEMRDGPVLDQVFACTCVALGTGLMALLAKWA